MGLAEYKKKRNFKATPEPGAKIERSKSSRFVVQRHQATRLHYDFRLELDGVLKSWAVPKGPSLNPVDKRLAVMVEDHPVSYIGFTGVIPEGNYGAGEVEIWDEGIYTPVDPKGNDITEKKALEALKAGSFKFRLQGHHLNGEFALVRLKDEKAWLLIKHRDEFAEDEFNSEDVLPIKTIKEVKRDKQSTAKKATRSKSNAAPSKTSKAAKPATKKATTARSSKAAEKSATVKKSTTTKPPAKKAAAKKATVKKNAEPEQPQQLRFTRFKPGRKLDEYIKPMLASLGDDAFDNDNWIFELKWDGYRAIAELEKKNVKIYSRNGLSFNERYPALVTELQKLNMKAVLDGEVIVFNEENRPDFQKLQHYDDNRHLPLVYYVFDILELNNKDLKELPLIERKDILQKNLRTNEFIRFSDHIDAKGKAFFEQVKKSNLEGIMAKKADSTYVTGIRTKEWLKIKHTQTREAVITGYTEGRGSRKHFGALILGEFKGKKLHYIGHTGTGFSDKKLKELWDIMQPLATAQSPYTVKIPVNGEVTWVKPTLVCEIKYTEITRDGILRHPVFLHLRDDKKPAEVKPEPEPVKTPGAGNNTSKVKKSKSTRAKAPEPEPDETSKGKQNKVIVADKHKIELSNINKIYWPVEKITKGDMLDYYESMAKYVLPYLKDRPLSLNRFPNGISDKGFYHKNAGDIAPSWMKTAPVFSESNDKTIDYLVCNNKASLLFIANLGCIEMNPWNSRVQHMENPDWMVIDIDPSDKNTFDEVIETANVVHDIFERIKVPSYCKTSGASGLHVYVPLGARYTYDQVKDFGNIIGIMVTAELPDTTTLVRSLSKREDDKIYVDYLQNRRGQTLASAYSLRPKPGATVSTPLEWKEVKPGLHPSQFHMHNILERVEKKGDLFSPVLGKGIDLNKTLKLIGG